MPLDTRLTRVDANRVQIDNPRGIDAVLFANEQVPVQTAAVQAAGDARAAQTMEQFAEASRESFDQALAIKQASGGGASFERIKGVRLPIVPIALSADTSVF